MGDINFIIPKINGNILILGCAGTGRTTLIKKLVNGLQNVIWYDSYRSFSIDSLDELKDKEYIIILDELQAIYHFLSEKDKERLLGLVFDAKVGKNKLKFILNCHPKNQDNREIADSVKEFKDAGNIEIQTYGDLDLQSGKVKYKKVVLFKN